MDDNKTHTQPEGAVTETGEQTESTPEVSVASAAPELPAAKTSKTMLMVAVVLALAIAAGLYFYFQTGNDVPAESTPAAVIGADSYPAVVATVNGEDLSNEMFARSYTQVAQSAELQGADLSNPEVKAELETQAMDTLINTALLIQAAKASGITVKEEAIKAEIDQIKTQFENDEAFAAVLEERGITDEMLRRDISTELLVNEFIATSEEIGTASVSEAEVSALYEQFSAGQSDVPPLEEVYGAIEQQLVAQKQNERIGEFILGLREKAEIKTYLE